MERACCFSGHRPHKLPWGYDEEHPDCVAFKARLYREIERLCRNGVTTFLSGMAAGVDLLAAEAVLDLKQTMLEAGICLVAVVPFEEQASKWSGELRARYYRILQQADETVFISDTYTPSCFQERNRYLVTHATHIIAVYSGESGGTRSTIAMALGRGLAIAIINPYDIEEE